MEINTRKIGDLNNSIIEVTVKSWDGNSMITEDVVPINGLIDENFILSLREVADELEEHNNILKELI